MKKLKKLHLKKESIMLLENKSMFGLRGGDTQTSANCTQGRVCEAMCAEDPRFSSVENCYNYD